MKFSEEQIDALLEVSKNLMNRGEVKGVLEDLLDISMATLKAERGFLVIQTEHDEKPLIRSARNIEPPSEDLHADISFSITKDVMESKQPVLTKNATTDPRFKSQESIVLHGIQSVACVPLVKNEKGIGALYMDSRGNQDLFTTMTLNYLNVVASFAVLAMDNALKIENLEEQNRLLSAENTRQYGFKDIVGNSPAMKRVFDLCARMARSKFPILILGESGTGKELVSKAIHYNSPRKDKPFMALYCGNISENLLESELFGHRKGAFTGATENKKGMLELADGGTFLLDEIADIPITLQAKLLRFLQEGEIKPVGDNIVRKVDVRILAATNKNLMQEVQNGNFREDLFYRLNVLKLDLPPLRDRREDIPLLALHFLRKHTAQTGMREVGISKATLNNLRNHIWHGNVRELENVIARAVVMCADDEIDENCILFDEPFAGDDTGVSVGEGDTALKSVIKQHVIGILKMTDGNRSEAKRLLGISRNYLYSLIDEIKADGIEI